jgi:hypothetical protein
MTTDAEITETTIAEVVEKPSSEEIVAADIAQVVQDAKPVEQKEVVIVETKPIQAPKYVDPIEEEYVIQRNNHIESSDWRNSPEGIKLIHESICFIGDQICP